MNGFLMLADLDRQEVLSTPVPLVGTQLVGEPASLGPLRGLDTDAAHAAAAATDYPDALVQLAAVASAARAGDIILSAARGWDFRARWEPIPHVSAHGALHAEHMMVPLLVNRPPARPPRRTTDLFASAVHALGVAPHGAGEGRSWLPG